MDVYDEIYAEIVMTSRFDENVDLSMTYLGRIDMKREEVMKTEESFPISEQGFVMGKLLNGEECQILLDIHTYIQFICIALDNTDIVIPTALDIDLQLKFLQLRLIYYTVRIIKSRKFKYHEKSEIEKFLKHF